MARSYSKTKSRRPRAGTEDLRPADWSPLIHRVEFALAILLTAAAVLLHLYRAAKAGALWRDEVSTIGAATMPSLGGLWRSLVYESYSLLPYLVVRSWVRLAGGGDARLRLLGALIGIGVIFAIWAAKRLMNCRLPLFTLALFGLSPALLVWGDSLRGNGLGAVFLLLAYGAMWKLVEGASANNIALAGVASVLSVQCVYQNAFLIFAICLGGALVCLRRRAFRTIAIIASVGAVSALSLLPYVPIIRKAQELTVVHPPTHGISDVWKQLGFAVSTGAEPLAWLWMVLCAAAVAAALVAILVRKPGPERTCRIDLLTYVVTVLTAGGGLLVAFLDLSQFYAEPWYYVILMGVVAVTVDVLLEVGTGTAAGRILYIGLCLMVAAVTLPISWDQAQKRVTNIDQLSAILEERAAPGDLILLNPFWYGVTFQRYYRGHASWNTLPPVQSSGLTRYDLLKEQMAATNPLEPVFTQMQASLSSGNRVWVIGNLSLPEPGQAPPSLPPAPNGPQGWDMEPYLEAWQIQVGAFLKGHASSVETIDPGVSPETLLVGLESPSLQVFAGWHE